MTEPTIPGLPITEAEPLVCRAVSDDSLHLEVAERGLVTDCWDLQPPLSTDPLEVTIVTRDSGASVMLDRDQVQRLHSAIGLYLQETIDQLK